MKKDILGILKSQFPIYDIVKINDNKYIISTTITATGADIDTVFNIPIPHQVIGMNLKLDKVSQSSISYILYENDNNNWYKILDNNTEANNIQININNYYRDIQSYKLTTNTITNNTVKISMVIKV